MRATLLKAALLLLGLAASPLARAHAPGLADSQAPLWLAQALFVTAWFGYGFGAGRARPAPARRAAFHAGMLLAGVALFGPLDDLAASSTAAHMVQHMMLIVMAAPLVVIGRPTRQWRALLGPTSDPVWRAFARMSTRPMACAVAHAAAIWGWHAPQPYMAAVQNTGLHVLEHASFLFTAWLFWAAALNVGRRSALPAGMALLFTLAHTGMLGALLTFAREPLYWRESRDLWDQQLAGLVMWVPGGAAYVAAMVWIGLRALGESLREIERPAFASHGSP